MRSYSLFRWAGQYFDSETNLYYNRYRYHSSETGSYLSQDPIRLAGNSPTLYGYVEDTNSWLDPFGLNARPETAAEFESRISKMAPSERDVAANGKVSKVARKNGWEKDAKLSKINDRDVYKDASGNLYSTDNQHGTIEHLDKRGTHLGEYNIDGVKTKPADASGKHNLKCG